MTTSTLARWLSLALLLVAVAAAAQTPADVEVGFRWTNVTGNKDMYKTQVNESNGVLIRSLSMSTVNFGGTTSLVDYFRLDASDLGSGPAGALRLEAGKSEKYKLRVGYRRTRFFSALPEFANPLFAQGVIPGQHTYDRTRNMFDADLDILPNNKIAPFIGFSSNRYAGPGTTTYHVGQDEFLLNQSLRDVDNEVRAGFNFTTTNFYGSLTQGWRRWTADEDYSLASGAGNNLAPVLGRDVTASSITRSGHNSGTTPFTNAYVTGAFDPRFKLVGSFVRFSADAKGSESESDAGSFASFEIGRFFNGINEQINERAKNNTWRGALRGEFALRENIDLLASYQRERRDLGGTSLINTIYLQSITFGGADPRDFAVILNTDNSLQRTEDVANVSVSARPAGPLTFRAGVSETTQNINVTPDLAEIVVPGPSEGGSYDRKIQSFDLLGTYADHGFSLAASWKHDHADSPILRTDFTTRDRSRVRASWMGGANNRYRIGVMAEENTPKNSDDAFQYKAHIRQVTADAGFAPIEALRFYASASTYRADTNILYRRPETFATDTSVHREDGKSGELGATVAVTNFSLDAALSRFRNEGTYTFKINRARTRLAYDFNPNAGLALEWDRDEYTEAPVLGNYDANRYGIYLRLHH